MSILENAQTFDGEASIWYNTKMKTHFITLGTSKDNIPLGSNALIEITHGTIEKRIVFKAKIIKATPREIPKYFVKLMRVPLEYDYLIPMGLKHIHYRMEILP